MRVLVTGGAGYIGSVLVGKLLDEGWEVHVVDNLMYKQTSLLAYASRDNFYFCYGDVRDERIFKPMIKKFDVIIPLAALVGMPACERSPHDAWSINRDAIIMLDRMRSKSQIMIFPNTNSGYGTTTGEIYCDENTPLNPISIYGKSKVEAERSLLDSGNVVVLRLATVFGYSPRMRLDLLVNDFTYRAMKDGYIIIYQPHFKRNYVHISDVCDCFLYCIENFDLMKDEVYNLGLDDANLSKEELAELIKQHIPNFVYKIAEIGEDPDKRNYIVSNEKIKKAGFTAKVSIDDGIEELKRVYSILIRIDDFCRNA